MTYTTSKQQTENSFNPLDNFSWVLIVLTVSLLIAIIKNFAPVRLVASWDIISYILLLIPLMQMIATKQIANPFIKWVVPFLLILIADVYYYNNHLTQELLPLVIYASLGILYVGSVQRMQYLFQVATPKLSASFKVFGAVGVFIKPLLSLKKYQQELIKNTLTMRIGLALLITLPVVGVFLFLFMASDPNFSRFITDIFSFSNPFKLYHAFTIPLLFLFLLVLFSYAISNNKSREINLYSNPFDPIVIGIFLGAINFLFVSFLMFQIAYIFGGESYIEQNNLNVAYYARKGFFELATVMGIVVLIFLIVIYRYKNEKLTAIMMSGLMLQTMVMGYASLQKMHLYQSIKGATVLRYYVEWFDYFLLLILFVGILYLFSKKPFYYMLNFVTLLGLLSFTVIASVNIDGMVAQHNISQTKEIPLDKYLISTLSIDALPYIQETDIKLTRYSYNYFKRDCEKFSEYNIGYCSKLALYGKKNLEL